MKRQGWTRLSQPGDKCSTRWVHDASHWQLRHCGHPTANWPYYLINPTSLCTVVSFNGKGFKTIEVCMNAVEGVLSGAFILTNADCVEGIERIMITANGEPVP